MTKRNPLTLHVASVLAMSLPGGVLAQDSGFALEEVMVTAQKRVQSRQDRHYGPTRRSSFFPKCGY